MPRLETEEVSAVHFVTHPYPEREGKPAEIACDIATHPESTIQVVHLAVRFAHILVLAFFDTPAEHVRIRNAPTGPSLLIPKNIPCKRALDSQLVARLVVGILNERIILQAKPEQKATAESVEEHRFHAKAVKAFHAAPLARTEPPVDGEAGVFHREELRTDKGFVEAIYMQVHVIVQLIVPHRFPLVTHETVRKVRIEAKTFARGHFHRPAEIRTVHVVTQFAKAAQLHRRTGRQYRTEGFRRIGGHKKRKKKQSGKAPYHESKDRIIYLPQNGIHEPIKDLP